MILKSLSRKSSPDKLIKYIFKEQAAYWERKAASGSRKSNWYVPGIRLTEKDIQYLEQEKADAAIMKQLSLFNGTVQEFIEERLLTKEQKEQPFIIKHNTKARTLNGFYKAFAENDARRLYTRSDQVSVYHVILSWSPKDAAHITDAMLKDIAGEYIRLRGDNCLVVGTKHMEGVGHTHLHLCVSGTFLNGKSARQSKADFKILKDKLQEYQREKYPFLSHSLPRHGKGAVLEKDAGKNLKPERFSERISLLKCLDEVYSKSESREHFIHQLEALGHTPYYRAGRFQGIKYNGETKHRIYRYGYDENKLLALDAQKREADRQLQDIQRLRNRSKAVERSRTNDMTATRRALLYEETTDPKRQEEKRALQQELVDAAKEFERTNASMTGGDSGNAAKSNASKDSATNRRQAETDQNKEQHTLRELQSLRENADRDIDMNADKDERTDSEEQYKDDEDTGDSYGSNTGARVTNDEPDDDTDEAE